jgi:hypothetical protein
MQKEEFELKRLRLRFVLSIFVLLATQAGEAQTGISPAQLEVNLGFIQIGNYTPTYPNNLVDLIDIPSCTGAYEACMTQHSQRRAFGICHGADGQLEGLLEGKLSGHGGVRHPVGEAGPRSRRGEWRVALAPLETNSLDPPLSGHEVIIFGSPSFDDPQAVEQPGRPRKRRSNSRQRARTGRTLLHSPDAGHLQVDVRENPKNPPTLYWSRSKGIHVQSGVVVPPGGGSTGNFGGTKACKSRL